jgi:hypothetical protein
LNCHYEGLKPQAKNSLFDYHNQCCSKAGEDGTNIPGPKMLLLLLLLVIRARSQGSSCNAAIRLIVNLFFLEVPTVASRCLHVLRDARDQSSERWNFNGRDRVAENFA